MAYDGNEEQFTKVDSAATRVLRSGRERVLKGWCQGTLYREIGGKIHFCAVGAIGVASRELWPFDKLPLEEAFTRLNTCSPPWGISSFNDLPGRTKEEVLAVFDQAIGD